jgi:hypothetical protein
MELDRLWKELVLAELEVLFSALRPSATVTLIWEMAQTEREKQKGKPGVGK